MTVRIISDLHFGHNTIAQFTGHHRGGVTNSEEHDEWLISQFNSVVTNKRDVTYILGDVAFNLRGLAQVQRLNGVKHLIMGNHDNNSICEYLQYFKKIRGLMKYAGYWLSHAPIREDELRGAKNIHGHTHSNQLIDGNYACVCVEALDGKPITFEALGDLFQQEESI